MTNIECPNCWEQSTIRRAQTFHPRGAAAFLDQVRPDHQGSTIWTWLQDSWSALYICPRCQCLFSPECRRITLNELQSNGFRGLSLDTILPQSTSVEDTSVRYPVSEQDDHIWWALSDERHDEINQDMFPDYRYW